MSKLVILAVAALLLISCGGDDPGQDIPPAPDVTGTWSGTFYYDSGLSDPRDFDILVDKQANQSFTGTWKYGLSTSWPADNDVTGSVYQWQGGATIRFRLNSGGTYTCCVPLFGCYEARAFTMSISGDIQNNSITDNNASMHSACSTGSYGEITLTRQ